MLNQLLKLIKSFKISYFERITELILSEEINLQLLIDIRDIVGSYL